MGEAVKFICLFVCLFFYNKKLPRKKIKFIKHIFLCNTIARTIVTMKLSEM